MTGQGINPNKIDKEDRMCRNKKQYGSEFAAKFYARTYYQRAYECPICHKWHLSSQRVNS